jgi:antitoxin PrlF
MTSAKVTSKGQITIPAEVRKALGLKAGVRVNFFQNANGEFVLSPKTGSIQDLKGCVPKLDYVPTIEEINEAIAAAAAESYLKSVARPGTDASTNEAA